MDSSQSLTDWAQSRFTSLYEGSPTNTDSGPAETETEAESTPNASVLDSQLLHVRPECSDIRKPQRTNVGGRVQEALGTDIWHEQSGGGVEGMFRGLFGLISPSIEVAGC